MVRLQQIVQSLYKTVKHEQTGSQEATKITKSYQTISNESKNQKLQYKTNKHTIPKLSHTPLDHKLVAAFAYELEFK